MGRAAKDLALSLARGFNKVKGDRAASKAKILRDSRKLDNAPSMTDGKVTSAGKLRSAADSIRISERKKRLKRLRK